MSHDRSPLPPFDLANPDVWVRDLDRRLELLGTTLHTLESAAAPSAAVGALTAVRADLAASTDGLIVPLATLPAHAARLEQVQETGVAQVVDGASDGWQVETNVRITLFTLPPLIIVHIPLITGTSNAQTVSVLTPEGGTVVIPSAFRPVQAAKTVISAVNSGNKLSDAVAVLGSDGTITYYPGPAEGAWSGTGVKTVHPVAFIYTLVL